MGNYEQAAREMLSAGVKPLVLMFERVRRFSGEQTILRTVLHVNSMKLGVLTPNEYRYVASRSAVGSRLSERQLEKVLRMLPQLQKNEQTELVTVPIYGEGLLTGVLYDTVFRLLTENPKAAADRLCLEFPADILYENLDRVSIALSRLKDFGIKIALNGVGDGFCPIMRVTALPVDIAFLDKSVVSAVGTEKAEMLAGGLAAFLHGGDIRVMATGLTNAYLIPAAEALGFDGFSLSSDLEDGSELEIEAEAYAKAEEERRKEAAEQKRLAEEAEQKRLAEEAEQKRLAEEAEQKRLAEEAEQKRLAEEAEQAERERLEQAEAARAARRAARAANKKRLAEEDAKRREELMADVDARLAAQMKQFQKVKKETKKRLAKAADEKPTAGGSEDNA